MTEQEGFIEAIADRDERIKNMAEIYEALTADRDSWKQAHDEQVTKLLEISANRDEYQREADNMAASHKVERDALTTERDAYAAAADTMAAAPDLLDLHKKHMELMMEIAQELKNPRLPLGTTIAASVRMLAEAAKEALDIIAKATGDK